MGTLALQQEEGPRLQWRLGLLLEGEHHSPSQCGFLNLAHTEPSPINIPGCHQASSHVPMGHRQGRSRTDAGSGKIGSKHGLGLFPAPFSQWALTYPCLA